MQISPQARVIAADGVFLGRALDVSFATPGHGLGRTAYGTWDEAQRKSVWVAAHQRRFALVDRDTLLATALRRDLSGMLDGVPLSICALGDVSSGDPGGSGAVRHLLQRLFDDAVGDGADAVLVFAPAEAASMMPERFERIPIADVDVHVVESTRRGAPMVLVRAGEERDLPAMVSMGAQRSARYRFHLTRDVALMKHAVERMRMLAGLGRSGSRQLEFLVTEEGCTAAAYIVLSRCGPRWTIEECGDRDPTGARVGAMLQAIVAREPAEGRPIIEGWLPSDFRPPQLTIASLPTTSSAIFARFLRRRGMPARVAAEDALCWRSDCF